MKLPKHARTHARTLTHKYTFQDSFVRKNSPHRRGCCLHSTQQTQDINIHAIRGIRIRNSCSLAATDIRLIQHCHWDRPQVSEYILIVKISRSPSWYFIFIYHHPPHRDNVTAPHGRPTLRSRLHFNHSREGRPRSP
jgi:hypothetical protein